MVVTMADDKKTTGEPTVVFATSEVLGSSAKSGKSRLTKKHILIAAVSVVIAALVVTAVLVSIRMWTDNNMDMLKYSMQAKGVSQNVSLDTDNNVVSYHVVKDDVEAWIVHDFNRGIQVSKVVVDHTTTCYVTPLNRSMATDASSIPDVAPSASAENAPSNGVLYQIVGEQISDISYLGHKASTMCQNIPTYHVVPECDKTPTTTDVVPQNSTSHGQMSKRSLQWCGTCPYANCRCACGCCWRVCAWFRSTAAVSYYSGGQWWCTFYYNSGYLYSLQFFRISNLPYCYYNGYNYYPV